MVERALAAADRLLWWRTKGLASLHLEDVGTVAAAQQGSGQTSVLRMLEPYRGAGRRAPRIWTEGPHPGDGGTVAEESMQWLSTIDRSGYPDPGDFNLPGVSYVYVAARTKMWPASVTPWAACSRTYSRTGVFTLQTATWLGAGQMPSPCPRAPLCLCVQ